ncbi:MAG TPA: hypothetical protein VMS86_10350, partial [Thermoanaerobaculia bacterium]|nr:hypothetical protein [Thermoanaerobaculia bacterium]
PRRLGIVVAAILVVWVSLTLPLALGERTLYFRDVFHSHFPWKAFGAAELREGSVPAFNPTWAMGQAFRGNPNTVPLYPGNVLYLLLPFWPAFNLHYALHWLLAGVAMLALARGLGSSAAAAVLAGLTYAGSGFMLAAMTFYNVLTVAAWWPLAILGAVRGGARGAALGGLACGMALYGGEPLTALLGCAPLVVLAISRLGLRRGLLSALTVGIAGAAIALPQLVATWRIVGFSFRGSHGVLASQASYYTFEPKRLLELLVPFPFGYPGWFGPSGLDAWGALDHLPYFFSIHPGLVALALGAAAWRSGRLLAGVAAAGFFLAWAFGLSGEALVRFGGGLFRSPEKLLFWPALMLPLLAAQGVDRVRAGLAGRLPHALLLAALVAAAGAVAVGPLGGSPAAIVGGSPDPAPGVAAAQGEVWLAGLVVAALLLAGSAVAVRLRSAETVVALQLVALLQLAPLWMTDEVAPYRELPFEIARSSDAVVNARMAYPPWEIGSDPPVFPPGPHHPNERFQAMALAPAPGVLHGLSYPLAPDLEGLHHLFTSFLTIEIRDATWRERARWLEVVGADVLVSPEPVEAPSLVLASIHKAYGARSFYFRAVEPAPAAWWPESLELARSPLDAFERVSRSPSGTLPGVVPEPIAHRPGGRVVALSIEPDRIELEVDGEGGLVVVRRAFQPLLRAFAGDRELPTVPANLCLLGVVVPPGRHHVEIRVSAIPEMIAAWVAALVALVLGAVLAAGMWRRRTGSATP